MENQLWNVFRETGDPMSYLLYSMETRAKPERSERAPRQQPKKDGTVPSF